MYSVVECNGDIEPIRQHGIDFMQDLCEEIDHEYYIAQWRKFIDTGMGVVFYLVKNNVVVGGIGAIKVPNIFNGKTMLVEMFWYVNPKHRKAGLLLYDAMEKYFEENKKLDRFAMIHMENSMPEKLKSFYVKKGFKLMETQWIKGKI